MSPTSPTSLLIATLVMLQRPCSRNCAVASLLLKRVADDGQLSPAEREVCEALADQLDEGRFDTHAPALCLALTRRTPDLALACD